MVSDLHEISHRLVHCIDTVAQTHHNLNPNVKDEISNVSAGLTFVWDVAEGGLTASN